MGGGVGAYSRDKKNAFWSSLTENYFNTNFLTIHSYFVRVQDTFSLYKSSSIKYYNYYERLVYKWLQHTDVHADDTVLYYADRDAEVIEKTLNEDLNYIDNWNNTLELRKEKTDIVCKQFYCFC